MKHVVEIVQASARGQDRATVIERPDGFVIVLADGAGGTRSGAMAAEAVVAAVAGARDSNWIELVGELDRDRARLDHGQCTAVVASLGAAGIRGVSVGDSGAWLVRGAEIVELTEHQARKPLVGGGCMPVEFASGPLAGATLVVASDGLWNYSMRAAIARTAAGSDLAAAARALVELVRLPNGELQDDVAIVLCR